MKNSFILIAINSKFIHSNLAVRYIKTYCESKINNLSILELSINDHFDYLLKQLYMSKGNVYAFSCYIWNIEIILKLCKSLKKIKEDSIIILGGPEVSYDSNSIMKENPFIDYIIRDEGEITFLELAEYINKENDDINSIEGVTFRKDNKIISNKDRGLIPDLDIIPFPYKDLSDLKNKIIYYETSRGCPFNCQYCLSSTIKGVRFFSFDRIKKDIDFFLLNGVKQVKLVDRTFNCKREHAMNIIEYLIHKNYSTNFHFEISADLLDDEFINLLKSAPKGMFQLEIGIQSTNEETLTEIKRKTDLNLIYKNIQMLLKNDNIHIHLDLIAGLPYEGLESFSRSFNDVYHLKSHMLQLGFLKLLKGSGLRAFSADYEIEYNDHAPYEVLKTKWLSFQNLLILKDIEKLLEIYHNSGKFKNSLSYILEINHVNPYDFFYQFSEYWNENDYYDKPRTMNDYYELFFEYIIAIYKNGATFKELLRYDFLMNNKNGKIPNRLSNTLTTLYKEKIHKLLKDKTILQSILPNFINMNIKDILKHVNYEVFDIDVTKLGHPPIQTLVIFDYGKDKRDDIKPITIEIPK